MNVNEFSSLPNTQAAAVQSQQNIESSNTTKKTDGTDVKKEVKGPGTYGKPELSKKAFDYYNSLKKKYGNLNFVLVSADKKNQAEAMKGSFATGGKLTVLIDTDKIEQMAEDENYRKKIEATISNAVSGLLGLGTKLESETSGVTAYGMTIDKDGNASYFAVVDKSLAAQKERISKKAEEKQEAKRTDAKKAKQKEEKERLEEKRNSSKTKESEETTITANSIEELLNKIKDYEMGIRADFSRTEAEKAVGQSIDYLL